MNREFDRSEPERLLADIYSGRRASVWSMPDGGFQTDLDHQPTGILPGAFNPLHAGHRELSGAAAAFLAGPVYYELSIINADKPPLDLMTVERRRRQFQQPLLLTAAPRFVEKARILPNTTFVVGTDTLERIVLPQYYDNDVARLRAALAEIRDLGCQFLVAGRKSATEFVTLSEIRLPAGFEDLFAELPESHFRNDLSSSEFRPSDDAPKGS